MNCKVCHKLFESMSYKGLERSYQLLDEVRVNPNKALRREHLWNLCSWHCYDHWEQVKK